MLASERAEYEAVARREGKTATDVSRAWTDLTDRLTRAPQYISASEKLVTMPGHLYGVVGNEQLDGAPSFFNGALTDAAKAHYARDTKAFARFSAARDATLAEIAKTRSYIDAHVAQWPENFAMGRQAYDAMLRDEQLLPLDSRDVERMANDELAHGWAEEAWLGTINVQETPKFMQPVSPGASMVSPRLLSAETSGYYFITPPASLAQAAARLDMNQDFDRDRILSTAAHEAMPGHFLQLSIARLYPRGSACRCGCNESGLLHRLHRWTLADSATAVGLHTGDGRQRLIARLSRSAALVWHHAAGARGPGAAGRSRQARERRAGRRELLKARRHPRGVSRGWP
jgi:hypothetical protein